MIASFATRSLDRVRSFGREQAGSIAAEFSMIAPVMIFMLFGTLELTDGVAAKRRVGMAASTLGDLASSKGDEYLKEDEIEGLMEATRLVLQPYGIEGATMRLTALTWDETEKATKVVWSKEKKGTQAAADTTQAEYLRGAEFTGLDQKSVMIDEEHLIISGHHLVLAELEYDYEPRLSTMFFEKFSIEQKEMRLPRHFRSKGLMHLCEEKQCTDGVTLSEEEWDAL